jgi:hypothetical protein
VLGGVGVNKAQQIVRCELDVWLHHLAEVEEMSNQLLKWQLEVVG